MFFLWIQIINGLKKPPYIIHLSYNYPNFNILQFFILYLYNTITYQNKNQLLSFDTIRHINSISICRIIEIIHLHLPFHIHLNLILSSHPFHRILSFQPFIHALLLPNPLHLQFNFLVALFVHPMQISILNSILPHHPIFMCFVFPHIFCSNQFKLSNRIVCFLLKYQLRIVTAILCQVIGQSIFLYHFRQHLSYVSIFPDDLIFLIRYDWIGNWFFTWQWYP